MRAQVLVPGVAEGPLLRIDRPLSFWGGVDPGSGRVIAHAHPQHGQSIAGQVIAMERSVGSSSGSSVLLELLATGQGPAAVILAETEQILTLGAVIAREMGYGAIPVLLLPAERFVDLPRRLSIDRSGNIRDLVGDP